MLYYFVRHASSGGSSSLIAALRKSSFGLASTRLHEPAIPRMHPEQLHPAKGPRPELLAFSRAASVHRAIASSPSGSLISSHSQASKQSRFSSALLAATAARQHGRFAGVSDHAGGTNVVGARGAGPGTGNCMCAPPTNVLSESATELAAEAASPSESSLHSEACNALGASDGVIHTSISLEVVNLRATANKFGRTLGEPGRLSLWMWYLSVGGHIFK